jgi:hypothetical protein
MNTSTRPGRSPASVPAAPSFGELLASPDAHPVFVVLGVQGSGTNLLRSILAGAFNFSVIQDQSFVYNAALKAGPDPPPETVQRQFDAIRARLFPSALTRKTQRRIKGNSSFDGIDEHFAAARASITSGAALARFIYAYSAWTRGTTLMAIKSDDLWETIGHIDTVLPHRRIILLTRDFRDNLLSITRKDFGPVDPLVAARYVKERFACYDAEYRRTPEEHRIHVRYEDLLEAPDAFVARFCEHFGLGASGETPPPVDAGRIRRNNRRKWASLTPRELAQCEAILRDELHTYGYGTEREPEAPPGPMAWLMARGRDTVKRIPQKLRRIATRLRA